MMWSDPIVDEIRTEAKAWADQFKGDVHALFEELRRLEQESGQNGLTLPPRAPTQITTSVAPLVTATTVENSQHAH